MSVTSSIPVARGARHAVSLVEVLVAATLLGLMAVALYATGAATVKSASVDRASEARRHLVHDLLERYGHSASDVQSLFPPGATPPCARTLSVEDALRVVALPGKAAQQIKTTLAAAGITGFHFEWSPAVRTAPGRPEAALRLDRLLCVAESPGGTPGANTASFRLFMVRGTP